MPTKKVARIVLMCFAALLWLMVALLGDIIAAFVLASPFAACGLVCLLARKNVGLWCCWIVYLFIEIYLRFATGVNWQFVFLPHVYTGGWTIHLIVAWIVLIAFMTLTVVTALRFRKVMPGSMRSNVIGVAASWAAYFLIMIVFSSPAYESGTDFVYSQAHRYVSAVFGWVRNIALAAALVFTVRLIAPLFSKKKHK